MEIKSISTIKYLKRSVKLGIFKLSEKPNDTLNFRVTTQDIVQESVQQFSVRC
jgi:vacuolar-type H+-ATPase subunit B/Vma2